MNKRLTLISSIFIIIVFVSVFFIVYNNKKEIIVESEIIIKTEENALVEEKILKDEKISVNNNILIQKETTSIILFYGDGCPHCEIVDEYLKENNIKDKINFEHKEVYNNKQNSNLLVEKAKICGMNINSIGVPFLWDGEKCLVGDRDIIEFFKLKIN